MTKKKVKEQVHERCEHCGGTGLRRNEVNGTALCECVAGSRRAAAAEWD